MMHSAHQIRQNTSKADEENLDIEESLKLELSNEQIQDIIRSSTEQLIHHKPYEEHQEHQQKGLNVMISDEELSGTGIPYIKTEMTLDTLSKNINKNEIFYDMDHKNDENRNDDAKLSGLFKPTNELSGSSDDKTRNNGETFTDDKQTYDNNGNSGTFQQKIMITEVQEEVLGIQERAYVMRRIYQSLKSQQMMLHTLRIGFSSLIERN